MTSFFALTCQVCQTRSAALFCTAHGLPVCVADLDNHCTAYCVYVPAARVQVVSAPPAPSQRWAAPSVLGLGNEYDRLEPVARRRIWLSLPPALVAGLAYWATERGLLSMSPDAIFAGIGMALFGAIRKAVRNPELFLGRLMRVCPGCRAEYTEPPKF